MELVLLMPKVDVTCRSLSKGFFAHCFGQARHPVPETNMCVCLCALGLRLTAIYIDCHCSAEASIAHFSFYPAPATSSWHALSLAVVFEIATVIRLKLYGLRLE